MASTATAATIATIGAVFFLGFCESFADEPEPFDELFFDTLAPQ